MTENLIKALLSMKSVKEMRAYPKVRREGDMWKREEAEDLNEIQERKKQRLTPEDWFLMMED